jgi:ubiquinone/menaquinone biosynthesis C-methylase UbiE
MEAERRQRDREAGQYDRLRGLRLLSLAEIPATLRPLQAGRGDRVVEAGCGTGRITTRLASICDKLCAVDHSLQSLRILRRKLHGRPGRIQLVQADLTRLPVRQDWATRALASQVLEHLPGEALRLQAVAELWRVLEPGGQLAVSVYRHLPLLRSLLPREGRHSGAIFFHRFEREEFARLLQPPFRIDRLTGRLIYLWLAHCHKPGVRVFRRSGVGETFPNA